MDIEQRRAFLKALLILSLLNLPYLCISATVGISDFVDSFENEGCYVFISCGEEDEGRLVVMKTSRHPDFSLEEGTEVCYLDTAGDVGIGVFSGLDVSSSKRMDIIGEVVLDLPDDILSRMVFEFWKQSAQSLNIFKFSSSVEP